MIIIKEIVAYLTEAICENCGDKLVFTGGVLKTANPEKYIHKCKRCKKKVNLTKEYPFKSFMK